MEAHLTLDELSDRLITLIAQQRHFQFIQQAHAVLAQVPTAPRLAAQTLKSLIGLGLGGPARELIQCRKELRDWSRQQEQLSVSLAAMPQGRISWDDVAEVYQRNLAALQQRDEGFCGREVDFEKVKADLQPYRLANGQVQVSHRRKAGQLRDWLPTLHDEGHSAEQAGIPPKGHVPPPLLQGIRHGEIVNRLYFDTANLMLQYSHPIYVVEPNIARFVAWLHAGDQQAFLGDERVHVFVGPDAVERFRQTITADPDLPLPTLHVGQVSEEGLKQKLTKLVETVAEDRAYELGKLRRQLEARYAERDIAYWRDRLASPGKVLGMTSRFTTVLQYSTRDALAAMQKMGYETQTLLERADHHQLSSITTSRMLLDFDPDCILVLDHLRYEYPNIPKQIPFLCWIQDLLANLLCPEAGESLGPYDYTCGHWDHEWQEKYGYRHQQHTAVDVPVSTVIFHDEPLSTEEEAKYVSDICFVSNASTPIDVFADETKQAYAPSLWPLLDALRAQAHTIEHDTRHLLPEKNAIELTRDLATQMRVNLNSTQIEFMAQHFTYRIYDWGRRQETLAWVARWARETGRVFRIHGRGWENHPSLGAFAAGVLEHGEPLRKTYRGARLALQLIPSGFHHQRSYELLASGTLPITRHCRMDEQQHLQAWMPFPRFDRITFRNEDEFTRVAEHFLANPDDREQIIDGMREVVFAEHTYDVSMRKVLEGWQQFLAKQES